MCMCMYRNRYGFCTCSAHIMDFTQSIECAMQSRTSQNAYRMVHILWNARTVVVHILSSLWTLSAARVKMADQRVVSEAFCKEWYGSFSFVNMARCIYIKPTHVHVTKCWWFLIWWSTLQSIISQIKTISKIWLHCGSCGVQSKHD